MLCIRPLHYQLLGQADVSYTMYYLDLLDVTYRPSIACDFGSASSQAMERFCVEQLLIARKSLSCHG